MFLITLGITIVILITNFVTIKYIRKINKLKEEDRILQLIQKDGDIHEYIKKLPSAYNQISVREIIKRFGLKRKFKSMILSLVEDMIYNKEIEGKIHKDVIYFSNSNQANSAHVNHPTLNSPPTNPSPTIPYPMGDSNSPYQTSSPNYFPQQSYDVETNSYGTLALTFGILGIVLGGFIFGILAIVFGLKGKKTGYKRSQAIAGFVLGIVDIIMWIPLIIFIIIIFLSI